MVAEVRVKGPDPWVSGCRAEIGKIRNVLIFTESFCSGIPMATMDTLGQVSYKKSYQSRREGKYNKDLLYLALLSSEGWAPLDWMSSAGAGFTS